jgi:hypothetical protein
MSTVPPTPYDQFGATSGDSFWDCTANSCTVFSSDHIDSVTDDEQKILLTGKTHQSNNTIGVNDMLFLETYAVGGNVQATQFANQQVN